MMQQQQTLPWLSPYAKLYGIVVPKYNMLRQINEKKRPRYTVCPDFGLLMAAGKPVDSVMLSKDAFADALHKGILQPIDEWMDLYGGNLQSHINPGLWNWAKGIDGKTYGIPSESILTPYVPMIWPDWLEAVHIPLPKTIDEFERAMIAIKKANPSRNGSKGELYPIFVELNGIDHAMLGAFLKKGISWWKSRTAPTCRPRWTPTIRSICGRCKVRDNLCFNLLRSG